MNRRLFLTVAVAASLVASPHLALAQAPTRPLVKVTGITVNDITAVAGQLIADATVTLNVVGRTITQNVQIPLSLGASPAATAGTCDILNLTLGPINLNLLGLVVNVDNCAGGPVTVNITGNDTELLGQILCGIAGLLNGGLDLGSLLDLLNGGLDLGELLGLLGLLDGGFNLGDLLNLEGTLTDLTDALTEVLNEVFANFFDNATATTGGHADGVCHILHLALGPIHLDVLGLVVDTSAICVDVTAVEGPGNLLGNLLCSLSDLLTNRGNNSKAELVLVRNILRILDQLGL